eukprot:TRINITY_DN6661_c0_g1_i1.p1 TRINITY_DN6661_c0_g1~~TRINITY_DN6661_c0_g1_i1.p1  ORF type:complete len:65 (+),score=3.08 TRINITY_DN6661_c0_g1_i1:332-526(+)
MNKKDNSVKLYFSGAELFILQKYSSFDMGLRLRVLTMSNASLDFITGINFPDFYFLSDCVPFAD